VPSGVEIIIIDNGSSDETPQRLCAYSGARVISNPSNVGCARAWNQGVELSSTAEWRIFLNNDVLLSQGWLSGLLDEAQKRGLDIVSPAMREGPINYNFEERAKFVATALGDFTRPGMPHGVCFAVRRRVFEAVGIFDDNFRVGQFEDTDFFRRAHIAGFSSATVGASFIHHFSSITQKAVKEAAGSSYESENRAYFRRKWNLHWMRRRIEKLQTGWKLRSYMACERKQTGSQLIDRSI
jgi:N-acetylglucosaminyl-diphospho-decaprenol L-rhamnosyltransferase